MASASLEPNLFDRASMLRRLRGGTFDVVVIGGGITGVGVALDAATRGLRTALVERDDFASGTSSKSSKLIHGGLRYLQQGEFRLVYEALRERQRLRKNAAHLVDVMPFMIPILVKDGPVPKKLARALGWAMWMYDVTGGARIGKLHKKIDARSALAHMPTMPSDRLRYAYLYFDAAADDARLCLSVARAAAREGAVVLNGARVVGLHHDRAERMHSVRLDVDGDEFVIQTRSVVNASGVWSDEIRALHDGVDPDSIRPAKGIHLTVPWDKVRNDIAVVIPVPKDKRSLFVVPWGERPDGGYLHSYVGTTDTDYDGPLDEPQCTADDVAYVLRALNASITTTVTAGDITGAWAGLRPLVKSAGSGRTADLSRRHSVDTTADGMVSLFGGKLTTYRQMAEDAVDQVCEFLGVKARCRTRRLRLAGAEQRRGAQHGAGLDAHLARRVGTDAPRVSALIAGDAALGEPLVAGLPYVRAEVVWAVHHEMARTVDDVLSRRTRARLEDRAASVEAAGTVARLMGGELGWSNDEIEHQAAVYRTSVAREIAAELPA